MWETNCQNYHLTYANRLVYNIFNMNKKQLKFSQLIDKHLRVPSEEDYKKMENSYIAKRLMGKRKYGMKKLLKDLYK